MNVYDFDNTIYRGESSLDLFFFYLRRHPSLLRYLPKAMLGAIRYKQGKVTIDDLLNNYANFAEDFVKNLDGLEKDISDFWDRNMHKIKPFFKDQRQDDDLIISASPDILLDELFARLGIKNYICSRVNKQTAKIEFLCYRENKVQAFKERYPDAAIKNFYTDSINDKPLMDLAENVFMVKGDKIKRIKP